RPHDAPRTRSSARGRRARVARTPACPVPEPAPAGLVGSRWSVKCSRRTYARSAATAPAARRGLGAAAARLLGRRATRRLLARRAAGRVLSRRGGAVGLG